MSQDIACPACGAELTMAQLFSHEDTHAAFARLASFSIPLGSLVLQYCTLFSPAKTRLTVPKQVKLILQLLPDLERRAITHRGRDWTVPLSVWAQAIDQMLAARSAGRLDLPMKGHAYLYSILMGLADKVEATAEAQAQAKARSAPKAATVQVRGQTMGIGQALQQVFGGQDPTLAKMDAEAPHASPVPEFARAQLAALRRKPASSSDESTT